MRPARQEDIDGIAALINEFAERRDHGAALAPRIPDGGRGLALPDVT